MIPRWNTAEYVVARLRFKRSNTWKSLGIGRRGGSKHLVQGPHLAHNHTHTHIQVLLNIDEAAFALFLSQRTLDQRKGQFRLSQSYKLVAKEQKWVKYMKKGRSSDGLVITVEGNSRWRQVADVGVETQLQGVEHLKENQNEAKETKTENN